MRRRSHRRYRHLGDADVTGGEPLRLTPGTRFSLERDMPAPAKRESDFGPSEPPPQRLPAKADKEPRGKILSFITPRAGNTMVGVGILSILGGVGYYVWKGGDLSNLWNLIKPSFGGRGGPRVYTIEEQTAIRLPPGGGIIAPVRMDLIQKYGAAQAPTAARRIERGY